MAYLVAGIDPGKTGGWAIFDRPSRSFVDAGPLYFEHPEYLFWKFKELQVREVLIERAQSAPGQANQFEYGRAFGRTEAAIMCVSDLAVHYCSPVWWKSRLNVSTDKEAARLKALRLIPGLDKIVTAKAHHGIAEAALIATVLTRRALYDELVKNNEKREKPKKKRASYRI